MPTKFVHGNNIPKHNIPRNAIHPPINLSVCIWELGFVSIWELGFRGTSRGG